MVGRRRSPAGPCCGRGTAAQRLRSGREGLGGIPPGGGCHEPGRRAPPAGREAACGKASRHHGSEPRSSGRGRSLGYPPAPLQSPSGPLSCCAKAAVAPCRSSGAFQSRYGVFLPYTPLHYLILEAGRFPALVMTSGNVSEEPIAITTPKRCRDCAASRISSGSQPRHSAALRRLGGAPWPAAARSGRRAGAPKQRSNWSGARAVTFRCRCF